MPESFRQKSSGALIFRPTVTEKIHSNQMKALAKDKEKLNRDIQEVNNLKQELTKELEEIRELKNRLRG